MIRTVSYESFATRTEKSVYEKTKLGSHSFQVKNTFTFTSNRNTCTYILNLNQFILGIPKQTHGILAPVTVWATYM